MTPELKDALHPHLSSFEVEALCAINKDWHYISDEDARCVANRSTKQSVHTLYETLVALQGRIAREGAPPTWVWSNLYACLCRIRRHIMLHARILTEVMLPVVAQRHAGDLKPPHTEKHHAAFIMPFDAMIETVTMLQEGGEALQQLGSAQAVSDMVTSVKLVRDCMDHYFDVGDHFFLPLWRKYVTEQESPVIVTGKTAFWGYGLADVALMILSCGNESGQAHFLTHVLNVPRIIQYMLILPACRRFHRRHNLLLWEVKMGEQHPMAIRPATGNHRFDFMNPFTSRFNTRGLKETHISKLGPAPKQELDSPVTSGRPLHVIDEKDPDFSPSSPGCTTLLAMMRSRRSSKAGSSSRSKGSSSDASTSDPPGRRRRVTSDSLSLFEWGGAATAAPKGSRGAKPPPPPHANDNADSKRWTISLGDVPSAGAKPGAGASLRSADSIFLFKSDDCRDPAQPARPRGE